MEGSHLEIDKSYYIKFTLVVGCIVVFSIFCFCQFSRCFKEFGSFPFPSPRKEAEDALEMVLKNVFPEGRSDSEEFSQTTFGVKTPKCQKDFSPVIRHLAGKGWRRLAGVLAKRTNSSDLSLITSLGISLGDPDLFWRGNPTGKKPACHWFSNTRDFVESERRWNLLKAWPSEDLSCERFFLLSAELFRRPMEESGEAWANCLASFFPNSIRFFFKPVFSVVANSFPYHLGLIIILPHSQATPKQRMMRAADLINKGIAFPLVSLLFEEIPKKFQSTIFSWKLVAGDFKKIFEFLPLEEPSCYRNEIQDFLVSISSNSFYREFGSNPRIVRLREDAMMRLKEEGSAAFVFSEKDNLPQGSKSDSGRSMNNLNEQSLAPVETSKETEFQIPLFPLEPLPAANSSTFDFKMSPKPAFPGHFGAFSSIEEANLKSPELQR